MHSELENTCDKNKLRYICIAFGTDNNEVKRGLKPLFSLVSTPKT